MKFGSTNGRANQLLVALLLVTFSVSVQAQVKIREKVDIKPALLDSLGGIGRTISSDWGDEYTSTYLTCGGQVSITPNRPYKIVLLPSKQVVVESPVTGQVYPLGSFPAGTYLSFGEIRDNNYPDDITQFTTYNSYIGAHYTRTQFFQGSYSLAFGLLFNVGDSSTCEDLRSASGPPRFPAPIVAPADTHLVAFFFDAGVDSIWFYTQDDSTKDSLFIDPNVAEWTGTIDLGSVKPGDLVDFQLKSMIKYTAGEIMYPEFIYADWEPCWWALFENWIDTSFWDYQAYLYLIPPRYKLCFERESAAPGDTVPFHISVLGEPDYATIESQMHINILQGRDFACVIDTSGVYYGADRRYGTGSHHFPTFFDVSDQMCLVISDSAPFGSKLIVQVVSEWDYMYGGRGEIVIAPPKVTFCPPEITVGDTADIIVKKQLPDCQTEDYSADQRFDVDFFDIADTVYGKLLNPCRQGLEDSLRGVSTGFKYVASQDTAPPDTHRIKFQVVPLGCAETCEPCEQQRMQFASLGKGAEKRAFALKPQGKNRPRRRVATEPELCGITEEGIGQRVFNILLGETKYFKVIKCEQSKRLIIDTTYDSHSPDLGTDGMADVLWSKIEEMRERDSDPYRLGVYWELDKKVQGDDLKVPDNNGTYTELPKGVLRLVGRYWTSDSTYKVKVTAHLEGYIDGHSVVNIVRPNRLGSTYNTSRDVENHEVDIDDWCIVAGGRHGIPPQFIKGQIQHEASKKASFGFPPTYVYEPYTVQLGIYKNQIDQMVSEGDNPYIVKENSMGSPPVPDHSNVYSIDYFKNVHSIWDVITKYSGLVSYPSPGGNPLYGNRLENGEMDFYNYTTVGNEYKRILAETREDFGYWESFEDELLRGTVCDEARETFISYLKSEWMGDLTQIKAQTRIAASYGLLQPLYLNVIQWRESGYTQDAAHLPEDIDKTAVVFDISLRHQQKILNGYLKKHEAFVDHEWGDGFEQTIIKSVYREWHKGIYGSEVVQYAFSYPPMHISTQP